MTPDDHIQNSRLRLVYRAALIITAVLGIVLGTSVVVRHRARLAVIKEVQRMDGDVQNARTPYFGSSRNLPSAESLRFYEFVISIGFSGSRISDSRFTEFIEYFPELEGIVLQETRLGDAALGALRTTSSLTHFYASSLHVTDKGFRNISNLAKLRVLEIDGASIGDAALRDFNRLRQLEILSLDRTRITDRGLMHLRDLTALQDLSCEATRVTGPGIKYLRNLTALSRFILRSSECGDEGLVYLQRLHDLKDLDVNNTHVTDRGLRHLMRLVNLEYLDFGRTSVTDSGVLRLRTLKKLKVLYLNQTSVTAAGIRALQAELPHARIKYNIVVTD